MKPSIRILVVPALAALLSACTAFYPPDEKDDGVDRCDNVGDCEVPDNSQWDVECVHGDGQDESTPKVCAPVFRIVSCDPTDYKDDHPLSLKLQEADETNGVYVSCDEMMHAGTKGCSARPKSDPNGECDAGLVKNVYGVCDEPDAMYPAVPARPELAGLDVLDQFCRNYFCSDEWMCDQSTGTPVCRPCKPVEDDTDQIGQGACAELYTKGADGKAARSTVYDVDSSCGKNGLSSDATTALRLAAEKVGPVPDGS